MDLHKLNEQYDPAVKLVGGPAKTPGYHTKIKDGTVVHDIRQSLDYALACLHKGDVALVRRAHDVIDAVLVLQDADPLSPTFGIWSWFYEEPVSQMSPPDWNWADFLGARLAQMLVQWHGKIDASLAARMRVAVDRAAMAIFRRHSPVSYTNIAVMGAGVCAAAGEMLGRPILLDYGRSKLGAVLDLAREIGGFSEYNSPTYTLVAIEECERILVMTADAAMHELARELLAVAWRMVAEHWHQPTNQWAGPHGRAYSDRLEETTLHRVETAIGRMLTGREHMARATTLDLVPPQPCPQELVPFFIEPITTARTICTNLGSTIDGIAKTGLTWLAPTCTLASANRENTWNQRRPIIGYWRSASEVAVFKVQWLMDGRDMPAMRLVTSQNQQRLLLGLYPLHGSGPFHPNFHAPADFVFNPSDLRLRFSVSGEGSAAFVMSPTCFELACADHRVRIDVADSTFDGQPVRWTIRQEAGVASLDGICTSEHRAVNFQMLRVRIAAGIQLLNPGAAPIDSSIQVTDSADARAINWPGSDVEPLHLPIASQNSIW